MSNHLIKRLRDGLDFAVHGWINSRTYALIAEADAYLAQPAQEPVGIVNRSRHGGEYVQLFSNLPANTKLYTAPQPDRTAELVADAARYRWLRDINNNINRIIDKVVGELPSGSPIVEFRAGEELDAAIDKAREGDSRAD